MFLLLSLYKDDNLGNEWEGLEAPGGSAEVTKVPLSGLMKESANKLFLGLKKQILTEDMEKWAHSYVVAGRVSGQYQHFKYAFPPLPITPVDIYFLGIPVASMQRHAG